MKFLQNPVLILVLIVLLGLFFRIYKLEIFYPWGHDQDLFAWIAKDILIDHHLRLIGQQTTIIGVFIGPIFYYLMALSFAIFRMNPLSGTIPITIISLLTIFSFYWVFNKFFGPRVGLIGAFLYAVSPGMVFFSRWAVPTQPTTLWTVWFMYALFLTLKGNWPVILLSILVGLIWHIHVAFIPLIALLPFSFWLSKKPWDKPLDFFSSKNKVGSRRSIIISFLAFLILMFPFFAFEIRYGFQQIKASIKVTHEETGEVSGVNRLVKIINLGGRSFAGAFFLSNSTISLDPVLTSALPFLLIALIFYLSSKKDLTRDQTLIILSWIFVVFVGQFFSKAQISEHYFGVLTVVLFLVIALLLNKLKIRVVLLIIYLAGVTIWFVSKPDDLGGYLYKKQTIEYIKNKSISEGYPCVAINFIENNIDKGNGFRYLSWFYNLKVITGGDDVPVYNVVTPWTISENEITTKFGIFGIIDPPRKTVDPNTCFDSKRQLLPLLGFTN